MPVSTVGYGSRGWMRWHFFVTRTPGEYRYFTD